MTTPREKIVVVVREIHVSRDVITRARLLAKAETRVVDSDELDDELTAVGKAVFAGVTGVDGLRLHLVNRHGITFSLVHEALWSWEEVEAAVVAAFAAALGVELDTVRDDDRTGDARR